MLNLHILIPLIIAVLMVGVVTIASGYPYIQAKLSVLFSGGLVLILALVQLLRELRLKKKLTDESELERKGPKHDVSALPYGLELAWMVGFGLIIYLLGFIIAIPLYICAYMKSHGAGWLPSVITGVTMSACCYVLFVLLLKINLHQGVIFISLGR